MRTNITIISSFAVSLRRTIILFLFCFASIQGTENQHVFSMNHWINVPDGTSVAPFFNPKDCTSDLPWDLVDNFSIAAGEIQKESLIQTLPLVTQLTFVLSGTLEVMIKNTDHAEMVTLQVEANQAVLMKPGSLFQFRNKGDTPCRVLYIVSPAYLFEMDELGSVFYDDAYVLMEDWEQLKLQVWKPQGMAPIESIQKARQESYERLKARKNGLK